jgi:hypothetical protein
VSWDTHASWDVPFRLLCNSTSGVNNRQQLHDIWHRTTVPTPHYAKCPEGRRAPFLFAPSVRKQTEDRCAFACSDFDSARLGQIHSTVLLF